MSGPNTNYDPVEVAALDPAAIEGAVDAALAAAASADTLPALKAVRTAHQGDRSTLALANREIGALPPSAKAEAGRRVGQAKARVAQVLAARQAELEAERDARILVEETMDLTVDVPRRVPGRRHPNALVSERIEDIFVALGWEIAEGPEVEAEWLNFDALNLGPDHPARQMQDTFYVDPPGSGLVLRTQTSPVQVRTMLDREPPIYVLCPGKVFRTDELDATHSPVFHQFEGLVVDEGITMAHLKGSLDAFVRALFGEGTVTRLRPSYFPFTEPSAEIDCRCWVCEGRDASCRVCSGTGWIELGGSGMVNRRVLRASGIDPDRYTGFAFGLGVERSLMLRNGVPDMRDIVEGDVRFNRQFGMEI
ncbi:phenylalanyl-tRNA synthetase (alpha subunit) [Nostocoides japonicum T1-X7]|uniref:Phenylalanine--tRNA ligase alpha subunit n=1 Tax=Nostocoides japonicum T1-X7 TaxID=1194083 RepID=A0A077LX98_9MICO|nr:phenylalanine--tRNA ligase subunit alpha [Tetrasphaera japonica]CCH78306.1 phenylalanyl-tRNA synthetase (alpha subunit) [Tetrasphaera japonica T1-X7]